MAEIKSFVLDARGTSPPARPLSPVVRVRFERAANGVRLSRDGSAFVVSAWKRVLVTSAHVLRKDDEEVAEGIVVTALDRNGNQVEFRAVSAAYPRDYRDNDLGVIQVAGEIHAVDPYDTTRVEEDASLRVIGLLNGEVEPREVMVETTFRAPWIRYPNAPTVEGMSGGPVVDAARKVVGVHTGVVEIGGELCNAGFNLDGPLLSECMRASFAILAGDG